VDWDAASALLILKGLEVSLRPAEKENHSESAVHNEE
jgi:hypothetical protein